MRTERAWPVRVDDDGGEDRTFVDIDDDHTLSNRTISTNFSRPWATVHDVGLGVRWPWEEWHLKWPK